MAKCSILIALAFVLISPAPQASEVDPYTYAYVPLPDSAHNVNDRLNHFIATTVADVNAELAERKGEASAVSDTEAEFMFFKAFNQRYIIDIAFGIFESCIAKNDCDGWPTFDRIQMRPQEGIFHAANWRYIPSSFYLAAVVNVCGVRMGTDKLDHFFSDAFRYFNASRSSKFDYDIDALGYLSLVFEQHYMGVHVTGVISHADVHANVQGIRFYRSLFTGSDPVVRRRLDGTLVVARQVDVCNHVTPHFDERVLPNEYVFSSLESDQTRERRRQLRAVIAQREERARLMAINMSKADLERVRDRLLKRRLSEPNWQENLPKHRLLWHAVKLISFFAVDADFRRVALLYQRNYFRPWRLAERKPVDIAPADDAQYGKDDAVSTALHSNE